MVIAIIVYVVLAIVVGVVADNIGRSGFGFGLLALLMSPILALLILAVIGRSEKQQALRQLRINAEIENIKNRNATTTEETTETATTDDMTWGGVVMFVAFVSIIIIVAVYAILFS